MQNNYKCPTSNFGKSEQCNECPNQSICGTVKPDDSLPLISANVSHFKLIFSIFSGKGGVGKSTITRNIAEFLSLKNYKVLLLDLDLSGPSIPKMTHTEGEIIIESNKRFYPVKLSENLGCISVGYFADSQPSQNLFSSTYKTNTIRNILINGDIADYEILIIDTPPNVTDEHLGIVNYLKLNFAIVVTTPQLISFQDVIRQYTFCYKNNIKILGIIENMKGFRCEKCDSLQDIFYNSDIEQKCKENNLNYIGSLPLNIEYGKSGDNGILIDDQIFSKTIDLIINEIK